MSAAPPTPRALFAFAAAVALVAASLMVGLTAQSAFAQDEASSSHPSHIHTGTCDQPGDISVPLGNIGSDYIAGWEPAESVEQVGSDAAVEVIAAITPVDAPVSAFLDSEHLLMVHESEDSLQVFIACGNIGGNLINGTDLMFGIQPLNSSGVSGVGWLTDDGDGTSTAYVFLMGGGETTGADEETTTGDEEADATPEGEDAAALTVDIAGFAFDPPVLEVKVGDTVAWTNGDSVPHTVTQDPAGSGFQSGAIQSGESFSFTFEQAGEFEYFCEFHPNMTGTIVVTE